MYLIYIIEYWMTVSILRVYLLLVVEFYLDMMIICCFGKFWFQGDELNSLMREILVRQSRQMVRLMARELARESVPPSAPVQRQMDLSSERFKMNNPPLFNGTRDPARVEEWIRTIEGIFKYADIPP